ncbi:MAG: XRE family transcriptional regulator [Pseudoclavibacter sp.]|nr:XRE family transcriptional regulator [Pseudoclavibacter sp.]
MPVDTVNLGHRIASVRRLAGFTQEQLARASGMERSAIAKIETGARGVTALELAGLARVLDHRIEWFFEEPAPSIVSHRNTSDPGEPSPRIDGALERIARAVEFTAEHDRDLLELLRTASVPAFEEAAAAADVEESARRARTFLGLERDEPLYEMSSKLAAAGVLSFVMELGTESADAGSLLLRSGAVALVNGSLRTGRRRLALAHEFGHVLLADEYSIDWRVNATKLERERFLDRFARTLLLPAGSLQKQWWDSGGDDPHRLREAAVRTASRFRVDMSTLARRLAELELVEPETSGAVRNFRTQRSDIVHYDLLVADELPAGEMPREYEAAVLRLFTSETVSEERALDLLLGGWTPDELPALPVRSEAEIWQFVS